MRIHSMAFTAVAAVSLAVSASSARAQNFLNGSAETIRDRYFRLTAAPVQMFGRDDAPDSTGAAFRLGYGFTDAFDVEAKSAFFDGVSLIGGDAQFRVFANEDLLVSLRAGGHQALVSDAPDSTALDLGAELSAWVNRRVEVYTATEVSFEHVHAAAGADGDDFTRVHVVPGARFGLSDRLDLQVEGGIGLNDNSPHYITAGLALHMPTSGAPRGPRR
jgi:hypothetical protein